MSFIILYTRINALNISIYICILYMYIYPVYVYAMNVLLKITKKNNMCQLILCARTHKHTHNKSISKKFAFFHLILHTTKITFFLFCFMSFIILYTHINALNISIYICILYMYIYPVYVYAMNVYSKLQRRIRCVD